MQIDLDNLTARSILLQHLVRDMAALVESRDGEIERLQLIIKNLQRTQCGRRSERLDPDHLALAWKTSTAMSRALGKEPRPRSKAERRNRRKRRRRGAKRSRIICRATIFGSISKTLRAPAAALHAIGESVSEMLNWVPA